MDEAEVEEFVRQRYGRTVAAVTLACGDRQAAEDAVQEALAKAWLHSGELRSLPAWVMTVALNEVRSRHRRRRSESRAFERWHRLGGNGGVTVSPDLDPFDVELRRLPQRQREVVVLHYFLDASVAEVASILGISEGTVKTSLHRARDALRSALLLEKVVDDVEA